MGIEVRTQGPLGSTTSEVGEWHAQREQQQQQDVPDPRREALARFAAAEAVMQDLVPRGSQLILTPDASRLYDKAERKRKTALHDLGLY